MEVALGKFMETLILPPGLFLILLLTGALLRYRFYRTGQGFIYTSLALLVLFSTPLFGDFMMRIAQSYPPLDVQTLEKTPAKAIVILAGGRYANAPEYDYQDTVSISTLERSRYGAYLHKKTGLPILVTGGVVFEDNRPSEGQLMKNFLEHELQVKTRWVEGKSRTTYENAIYSYDMLNREGITDIILVTHAYHMPRAVEAFTKAGFHVIPAGVDFFSPDVRPAIFNLLPSLDALISTRIVLHEWIGRAWYHLRYY